LFSLAFGAIVAVGLAGPAAAQSYPPSGPTIVVSGVSANVANVSGCGWQPGTQVSVTATSGLGTATANSAGCISQNVTVPCSLGNGTHTLSASGIATAGTSQTVSTQITLSNCAVSASTGLAFTGSSVTFPLAVAGVGLVLVGSVLTVGMRRRRSAHTLKV